MSNMPFKAIVQSMQQIFQTCACIFTFSQRYSTQFTAQKETVQDTAVFSRSACLKFQLRFHARNALFPCKCVIFFDKAALLRQKKDYAWRRSRFNCSWTIFWRSACSIWTCSLLKSTHGQHERMQNTFQEIQNLQLEIALMSVEYQIHFSRNINYCEKTQ